MSLQLVLNVGTKTSFSTYKVKLDAVRFFSLCFGETSPQQLHRQDRQESLISGCPVSMSMLTRRGRRGKTWRTSVPPTTSELPKALEPQLNLQSSALRRPRSLDLLRSFSRP